MSQRLSTWCRCGECMAALVATVEGGRIQSLVPNDDDAMGRHGACGTCLASANAANDPRRIKRPRRRTATGWEEIDWDTAISEIGARLKDIRKQSGARAIATYAGAPVGTHSRGLARTLAFSLGLGTPNLFSPLSQVGGPWLRASELVLGHPAALQADIGRAHYVLLLGANQEAQGWGPMQAGRNWAADLAFSRKTKGTKVIAADPRRTPIAAGADQHLRIRPGTEIFMLLGMIDQICKNNWHESQYVRDFCRGYPELVAAVAPWTTERAGEICGVNGDEIAGVALKFSRAAMAVAHRSPQALQSEHGTLVAWAILVLHAITANLLRPGGVYENKGVLDIHAVVSQLPTAKAPRTRVGDFPLLCLQAPGALLADEIGVPGEGQVRALLSVHGNPARELPGGPRLLSALSSLDLLVAIDIADHETTELAHYVLPSTHPWEREDLHLHDTSILPYRTTAYTPALVSPPGEARSEADILASLFRAVGPTIRGGVHGAHLRALGAYLAATDLAPWEERLLAHSQTVDLPTLKSSGSWWGGEVDRATWRLTTPSGKIELLPNEIAEALRGLRPPVTSGGDKWLLTSAAREAATRPFDRHGDPGVNLHPSLGFAEGERVRVATTAGSVEAVVHLDDTLRDDVVDLPAGYAVDAMALVPTDRLDPLSGSPAMSGLSCRVERA